jgi:hypothetical protein
VVINFSLKSLLFVEISIQNWDFAATLLSHSKNEISETISPKYGACAAHKSGFKKMAMTSLGGNGKGRKNENDQKMF